MWLVGVHLWVKLVLCLLPGYNACITHQKTRDSSDFLCFIFPSSKSILMLLKTFWGWLWQQTQMSEHRLVFERPAHRLPGLCPGLAWTRHRWSTSLNYTMKNLLIDSLQWTSFGVKVKWMCFVYGWNNNLMTNHERPTCPVDMFSLHALWYSCQYVICWFGLHTQKQYILN